MWREAYESDLNHLTAPSLTEMRVAFEILANFEDIRKICFFIDGLDEYTGDYEQCITTWQLLARNPKIKIVISSRPTTSCVEAFSDSRKLYLHELTERDIVKYVQDIVGTHPRIKEYVDLYPIEANVIMTNLLTKASGVYLWVVLACRSLLKGFEADDHISDLEHPVKELPPELEQMFRHVLSRIESRYWGQAARLLKVVFTAQRRQC